MTDLGKIGYVLKGDYDATASYEYLDVVYYNGSTYAAKKNVTGVAPTTGRSDDLNWQIMVNPAAGLIRPLGTITFAELPESPTSGDSYDISNSFTTDNRFKEGAGKKYPGGVNVYYTADGYWDILAGKPIVSAINGMKIDGTDNVNNYGVCSTAGATVAKTVSITGNFLLVYGAEVDVKFTNNNTATAPTLNVNNTGAKPIYYAGGAIEARNIMAGMVYSFRYNGTQWDLVGGVNSGHVIEDEDGTDYSNRTNLVFENAEVTDDPTHDATVVRPNGDKSHVFETLDEANEALADGLLKDGDVVYIKQGPGEVNISSLVVRIGLVEDNKQDKTLSSPIDGQTTVEGALSSINAHLNDIDMVKDGDTITRIAGVEDTASSTLVTGTFTFNIDEYDSYIFASSLVSSNVTNTVMIARNELKALLTKGIPYGSMAITAWASNASVMRVTSITGNTVSGAYAYANGSARLMCALYGVTHAQ